MVINPYAVLTAKHTILPEGRYDIMATENSRATDNLWQQARSIPTYSVIIRILLIPVFVLTYIHARYITAAVFLSLRALPILWTGA